jgi:N-acetylglucosamine kinase-like BadF-type ATPase
VNVRVAGLDVGATKSAVMSGHDPAQPRLVTLPSPGWEAEPADAAAAWLVDLMARARLDTPLDAIVVGAQGLDSPEAAAALQAALCERLPGGTLVRCVNDAELVVPAAGFSEGIGLIAGTGCIGVGRDLAGKAMFAGGWGWVLGDEAGAVGIVREAVKAVAKAADDGQTGDPLTGLLLGSFQVPTVERLTRSVNDNPTPEHWAPHCPVVFEALALGSRLAREVVDGAGRHLALLAGQLAVRGATGRHIVAAGSVIANQPALAEAARTALAGRFPGYTFTVLAAPPAEGAYRLARSLAVAAGQQNQT